MTQWLSMIADEPTLARYTLQLFLQPQQFWHEKGPGASRSNRPNRYDRRGNAAEDDWDRAWAMVHRTLSFNAEPQPSGPPRATTNSEKPEWRAQAAAGQDSAQLQAE